jgi:hypothetical protein
MKEGRRFLQDSPARLIKTLRHDLHAAFGFGAQERDCTHPFGMSRRCLLQGGGLAALRLGLPELLRAESDASARANKPGRKNCILLVCYGGTPHLDTWDMKPEAPAEIRGEFKPAATSTPGILYCDLLPRLGRVADLATIVRSVTHEQTVHGAALGFVLTGTRTLDPGDPNRNPVASTADFPGFGAAVARFQPARGAVPTAVALPYIMRDEKGRVMPGQRAGILGDRYNPWLIEQDPNAADFRVDGLQLPAETPLSRLDGRQALLRQIEEQQRGLDQLAETRRMADHYQRAFNLLTSARTREAFRIDQEKSPLRDRFGRNPVGQSCLLACRLIAAGVRFVQVNMSGFFESSIYGWDTHSNNFGRLRANLLPTLDAALASLLESLRDRGLLEDTLVVCAGEFGRTPRVNRNRGRDHWPHCYSVLLAGGGVAGGRTYGQSDKSGAYPLADAVTPEELAATIYHAVGVDWAAEIHDPQGRPVRLVQGQPVRKLFA